MREFVPTLFNQNKLLKLKKDLGKKTRMRPILA